MPGSLAPFCRISVMARMSPAGPGRHGRLSACVDVGRRWQSLRVFKRHRLYILLALAISSACHREPPPSHIFQNGKIVTVDPQFHIAEAMAIRDGRIVATGANADIAKLAGSSTERIDLGGKTVLPGLIDSHVHAPSASMYEFEQPVPDMETIEDVLGYFRERAGQTEAGHWITCRKCSSRG